METLKLKETEKDAPAESVAELPPPFTETLENVSVLPSLEISTGSRGACGTHWAYPAMQAKRATVAETMFFTIHKNIKLIGEVRTVSILHHLHHPCHCFRFDAEKENTFIHFTQVKENSLLKF